MNVFLDLLMKMGDTDDLLQGQIIRCRFTLPEGLKELMSDISREVLRAQPENIYDFITDYLAVMLVSRDNLYIAAQVCDHVCECHCEPELYRELQDIGLDEIDAKEAHAVIMKYYNKPKVGEGSLLATLMKKTSIDEDMIPTVLNAIRVAYLRYQRNRATKYEMSSESEDDEISRAAAHTLNIYRQTNPDQKEYNEMATKIQASYRAYCVRREIHQEQDPGNSGRTSPCSTITKDTELELACSLHAARVSTVSSISLAGSLCPLPTYVPYNANDIDVLSQLTELPEKEHITIDYTTFTPRKNEQKKNKNITFGHSVKEKLKDNKLSFEETETFNVTRDESEAEQALNVRHDKSETVVNNVTLDKSTFEETDEINVTYDKSNFDKTGDQYSEEEEYVKDLVLSDAENESAVEDVITEVTDDSNDEELEYDDNYTGFGEEDDDTESVIGESTSKK